MKRIYSGVIAILLAGCTSHSQSSHLEQRNDSALWKTTTYTVTGKPGEWEPTDRVVFQSPTYDPVVGESMQTVQLDMMKALLQHDVGVELIANDQSEGDDYIAQLTAMGVSSWDLHGFETTVLPLDPVLGINHSDVWARDNGPIIVTARAPGSYHDVLAVIDDHFNGWGYFDVSDGPSQDLYTLDDTVAPAYATYNHMPIIHSDLISEGGAVVTNGKGTVIYSLPALAQHNPTMTQAQIETELKRIYGGTKAIGVPYSAPQDSMAFISPGNLWTGLGQDGGDLYSGFGVFHVDMTSVPYSPTGIFVPQFSQSNVTNDFEQACHDTDELLNTFWQSQTDQDGHHFTVTRIPDPCLIQKQVTPSIGDPFTDGDAIADILSFTITGSASQGITTPYDITESVGYVNYLTAKGGCGPGVVIIPKFYKPGRPTRFQTDDAAAVTAFQTAFPGRDIVQVDEEHEEEDGGGGHCTTQEIPNL